MDTKNNISAKHFTVLKTGYSAGVYGCSDEFFNCVYVDETGMHSFRFKGMYGTEERVETAMKEAGYSFSYTSSNYGQLKGEERKHAEKWSLYEKAAIDFIKNGFKDMEEKTV